MSNLKSFAFGALGAGFTVVTSFVAFVLFLGSITGSGNDSMLTAAMVVFSLPFVLGGLITAYKVWSKINNEGERAPDAEAD